jgi:hypothetical protein
MTEKQAEKLKQKIKQIKAALAADKKRWGGYYDDSRGLRYLPPRYYLKLGDYTGGLRYVNWFKKNFPDDSGFPDFLFEWTVILFKRNRLKEAEKKVFETFCANTYIFDQFFGKPIVPIEKYEGSNLARPDFTDYFIYSSQDPKLADFSQWLAKLIESERFQTASQEFIDLHKQLKHEHKTEIRRALVDQASELEKNF